VSVHVGTHTLTQITIGAAYLSQLWEADKAIWAGIYDSFNRPDQASLTSPWVIETGINSWHIGVSGNSARLMVPDGLDLGLTVTDAVRHSNQVSGDDGHLEIQVATIGDPNYRTMVWRRYSNDGYGLNGVGIDLYNSRASIAYRTLGVNAWEVDCGLYAEGDVLRLKQAGDVHTLLRNGTPVGTWNDQLHLASKGATYRSVAIHMQGAKQSLGPRRFSPALNYIDAA
jgi:hypothetical protein